MGSVRSLVLGEPPTLVALAVLGDLVHPLAELGGVAPVLDILVRAAPLLTGPAAVHLAGMALLGLLLLELLVLSASLVGLLLPSLVGLLVGLLLSAGVCGLLSALLARLWALSLVLPLLPLLPRLALLVTLSVLTSLSAAGEPPTLVALAVFGDLVHSLAELGGVAPVLGTLVRAAPLLTGPAAVHLARLPLLGLLLVNLSLSARLPGLLADLPSVTGLLAALLSVLLAALLFVLLTRLTPSSLVLLTLARLLALLVLLDVSSLPGLLALVAGELSLLVALLGVSRVAAALATTLVAPALLVVLLWSSRLVRVLVTHGLKRVRRRIDGDRPAVLARAVRPSRATARTGKKGANRFDAGDVEVPPLHA